MQYEGNHRFFTAASASAGSTISMGERLRITDAGTVLVGKTAEGTATDGIELNRNDVVVVTRNGDSPLILNRRTSDGSIIEFRKDNAIVGSIGTDGGSLVIGGGDVGLGFLSSADALVPINGGTRAARDNAIDLGTSGIRFKDLHLSGTAHTSQYRLKNGSTTTGGLFHEKDVTGSGSSYDTTLFAETGNAIHFMVNGNANPVGTFDTSGNLGNWWNSSHKH